ncbi:acetyltransferase [Colletotrichum graminicola]|nr:acetyltransferase [Colletotrichum graminicola]
MRLNEHTGMSSTPAAAIATPRVTLVPYEAKHVERYHEWMSDPDIQEATASEPLTLEEEYENQQSWRTSHDKLTFIICHPLPASSETKLEAVQAGEVDAPGQMIGDINFFIYPDDDDGDDDEATQAAAEGSYVGEVDVMIASKDHRGKGIGHAAVTALLTYVHRNKERIIAEYVEGEGKSGEGKMPELKGLMVKIKEKNAASIALFRRLGFVQKGVANYFGEIKMVGQFSAVKATKEYREIVYSR